MMNDGSSTVRRRRRWWGGHHFYYTLQQDIGEIIQADTWAVVSSDTGW